MNWAHVHLLVTAVLGVIAALVARRRRGAFSRSLLIAILVTSALVSLAGSATAQHEGHGGPGHGSAQAPPPAEEQGRDDHAQHREPPEGGPQSIVDLELRRNASGTAWQPESTPHAALHTKAAGFELMFHTLLFAGYDAQTTDRGDNQAMGVGWLMGMARRRFANSSLTARVMLSPEPWSAGYRGGGYPLLLQTGETFEGQPPTRPATSSRPVHGGRGALHARHQ